MGATLLLHAMVDEPSAAAAVVSTQINVVEHARHRDAMAAVKASDGLAMLPKLVHTLSAALVHPALSALRAHAAAAATDARAGSPTAFGDLLPELQFAVLAFLPPHELAATRQLCTALLPLASDELLWTRLYEQKWGEPPALGPNAPVATAARAYSRRVTREKDEEKQRERRREQQRIAAEHDFMGHPPPGGMPFGGGFPGHDPFGGFPGPMPPGFMGGDFDRMPGGGALPGFGGGGFGFPGGGGLHGGGGFPGAGHPLGGGGLPAGPGGALLPPGAVPPGARHDPISPLIDQDGMSGGPMGPYGGGRGMPGRGGGRFGGGFPGRGGGRFGRGGGWDPDSPNLPDIL